MRDFTLKKYQLLLEELLNAGYSLMPVIDSLCSETTNTTALRHDVDRHINRALMMAEMEHDLGLKTTYFFRKNDILNNTLQIKDIADMGHEIGYHYENLAEFHGNKEKAMKDFTEMMLLLRKIAWADGISMHGSPLSRHNNIDIWKDYSYRDLGVAYEASLDIRYNKVLYLTDTGRRWDCGSFNFRDRVAKGMTIKKIRNTDKLLKAVKKETLPPHIILNIHPQRWSDNIFTWWHEFTTQHLKNFIKCIIMPFFV